MSTAAAPTSARAGHRRAGALFLYAAAVGATMLAAACAPLRERPAQAPGVEPPGFPSADYAAALRRGDRVYAVDPARSLVTVIVHRGGTLARLGHDHVVAIRDVHGEVDTTAGRADLYAPLDRMSVDEPALLREAHFDTQPSAADIAGTRTNMLERVLHVERHPYVEVAVRRAGALHPGEAPASAHAQATIALNGVNREVPLRLTLSEHGDAFEASGSFAIDQTDFGLTPMSLFGGAITVEDRLELRFDVRARREAAPIAAAAHRGSG